MRGTVGISESINTVKEAHATETKRLFLLFRFYTETESFGVSIEPKQTEEQPKQFDIEHVLVFFRKFRDVSVCFGLFRNSSVCFGV